MDNMKEKAMALHKDHQGKLGVYSKVPLKNKDDLTLAYSPGVAEPCKVIAQDKDASFIYTNRANSVAVVSDGSAVLGLGDIGPEAALPVMEGKAVLFKGFAGIDAVPVVLDTKDVDEIVEIVRAISKTYGGINLEDIAAPRCFAIEEQLRAMCDVPIFHDDQHGTAVIATACLLNCAKLMQKKTSELRCVVNGAGAAAIAIAKLWLHEGVEDLTLIDSRGAIYKGRNHLNEAKEKMAEMTNPRDIKGDLAEALVDADVFLGVSQAGVLTQEMIKTMAPDPVILALANPVPEIMPDEAQAAGARVICTGRSDFPNQVNNVLAFPGIFRGALDIRARDITDGMKLAAAYALADIVGDDLSESYVIPDSFDERVAPLVARAVAEAGLKECVARNTEITPDEVKAHCEAFVKNN